MQLQGRRDNGAGRIVIVVKGDRAGAEFKAGRDFVLDFAHSRCSEHFGGQENGFVVFDLDGFGGYVVEDLIKRCFKNASRKRDRRLIVFGGQTDVVDIQHAARTDVDRRVARDGFNRHNSQVVLVVDLFLDWITGIDDRGRVLPGNVDRVVAEHAGVIAFVILDDGGIERAAFDVDRRVFEPTLAKGKIRIGLLGKRHALGVGEIAEMQFSAFGHDMSGTFGRDSVDRRVARGSKRAVNGCTTRNGSNRIRSFDRELAGGSDIKTGIDRQASGAAGCIVAESHIEFAAVDSDCAGVDVAAAEGCAVSERHFIAVVCVRNVGRAARCDQSFVDKLSALADGEVARGDCAGIGTCSGRDIAGDQTFVVDLRADDAALFDRTVGTHDDR